MYEHNTEQTLTGVYIFTLVSSSIIGSSLCREHSATRFHLSLSPILYITLCIKNEQNGPERAISAEWTNYGSKTEQTHTRKWISAAGWSEADINTQGQMQMHQNSSRSELTEHSRYTEESTNESQKTITQPNREIQTNQKSFNQFFVTAVQ